ncbi:MAG TPA: hypothetical protein ENF51_01940 [Candidatus Aenigmarchaeota archaeon]|nr:hypothetical protein [Candidatus Aenigmarchaeota archaeon]
MEEHKYSNEKEWKKSVSKAFFQTIFRGKKYDQWMSVLLKSAYESLSIETPLEELLSLPEDEFEKLVEEIRNTDQKKLFPVGPGEYVGHVKRVLVSYMEKAREEMRAFLNSIGNYGERMRELEMMIRETEGAREVSKFEGLLQRLYHNLRHDCLSIGVEPPEGLKDTYLELVRLIREKTQEQNSEKVDSKVEKSGHLEKGNYDGREKRLGIRMKQLLLIASDKFPEEELENLLADPPSGLIRKLLEEVVSLPKEEWEEFKRKISEIGTTDFKRFWSCKSTMPKKFSPSAVRKRLLSYLEKERKAYQLA